MIVTLRKPDAKASGFQLSVPLSRNVKRPYDVKCASCVIGVPRNE